MVQLIESFLLKSRQPPTSTLFPYTTLFRSKRLPKLGVYINMFTIGIFIDVFNFLLPDVDGWIMHILIFTVGLFVMAFGIAFYITPNLGAGPRDTLMLFFVEKFNLKLSSARNLMEIFADRKR